MLSRTETSSDSLRSQNADEAPNVSEPLHLLLVTQDHYLVRQMITACGLDQRLQISGWAAGETELCDFVEAQSFDLALIDLDLPFLTSIGAIQLIAGKPALAQVLVVLSGKNIESVMSAVHAGVQAYLLKDKNSSRQMVEALIELNGGACSISPEIARFLVERFQHTH